MSCQVDVFNTPGNLTSDSVNVVSNRLGHSQPSTTLDINAHLFSETQADAARIMDDLVTPIKLDMREFGSQKVIQGEKEMDIPE